jgi:hypothetical protein
MEVRATTRACGRRRSRQVGSVTATCNRRLLPKIPIRFSSEDDFGELDDPQSTNPSIGLGVSYQF